MKYMGLALMAATLLAGTASAQEKEKRDDTMDKAGRIASQPARDIAPRGHPLGPKQRCHVVEHHHDAIQLVLTRQARGRDG